MTDSDGRRDWIRKTAHASLVAQVIFFLVSLGGFMSVNQSLWNRSYLVSLLVLEEVAQLIEFIYYVVAFMVIKRPLPTSSRYLDWFFSTPTMLISAIGFMHYERERLRGTDATLTLMQMIDEHAITLSVVLLLNGFMLLSGYFVELGRLPLLYIVPATIAFVGYYVIMLIDVGMASTESMVIWAYMFCVWGLYGVAITRSYVTKSIAYNILDVFSKNIYGAFLAFYIVFA